MTIAFASDLHVGPTTHPSLVDEAMRAIEEAEPDVVLLGGDYVFLDTRDLDVLASRLSRLSVKTKARYAVMGNHDLWADDASIEAALAGNGFRVLCNESVALEAPFDHVSICGVDEPWTGAPDAARAFEGARDVRVLLVHAPSGLLVVPQRFDLALAGHTHGGHIALPFGIPIVSPGPLSRRYPHGEHALDGGATLVVSRGIGATEIALRLFADPDVRIVTLGQ